MSWNSPREPQSRWLVLALSMTLVTFAHMGSAQENKKLPAPESPIGSICAKHGVTGGLCVQVGSDDLTAALDLGRTGRVLVEVLDTDAAKVERARKQINSTGLYGLISANRWASDKRLPYAENLVNLLIVEKGRKVPLAEAVRVLRPAGVFLTQGGGASESELKKAGLEDVQTVQAGGDWTLARKTWPAEMDDWSHPLHGPDGNTVSNDKLLDRLTHIRWLSGPMLRNPAMITAGGRLFAHGVNARDAFNGLLLWNREIGEHWKSTAVASADRLYVVHEDKLQALDGATGETVKVYTAVDRPNQILNIDGTLVVSDKDTPSTVSALNAKSGKLLWSHKAGSWVNSMVAGDGGVYFFEGGQDCAFGLPYFWRQKRRGARMDNNPRAIVKLDFATGKPAWRVAAADHPWAEKVKRLSYHRGYLVCEISKGTCNPFGGNAIKVIAADTGKVLWGREYAPDMNHNSQARALHIDSLLWISVLGNKKWGWEGLDPATGKTVATNKARSFTHCSPPLATTRFFVNGPHNLIDISTGVHMPASRVVRQSCSWTASVIPANGLMYVAPRHCACYPMLKSYIALGSWSLPPGPAAKTPEPADFAVERGPAFGLAAPASAGADPGWPCYRADIWRSASTTTTVPANLEVLWTADIGDWPRGPLAHDWKNNNPFVRGPVTPPVAAGGLVVVAQGDRHRVVALDARTGKTRWTFTADGRVDTPPTLAGGQCLLGTRSGTVYALNAKDGQLAWRLRVAPEDERIVAFGQLESQWPTAGSVLVVGNTAYVAAGRHPLAYGGIRILALDTATGAVKWVTPINKDNWRSHGSGAGLGVDIFDLLVGEARRPSVPAAGVPRPAGGQPDYISMSRWQLDPASGELGCDWKNGYYYCRTGGAGVIAPRGLWTYGERMGRGVGQVDFSIKRPLAAFRGGAIFSSTTENLYRSDFTPESIAAFKGEWHSHRSRSRGHYRTRNSYLHSQAGITWRVDDLFGIADPRERRPPLYEGKKDIIAMVLAGDTVFVAGAEGRLLAYAAADGKKLAERDLPPVVWDGMAAANGCLYVSTADGKVLALGRK